MTKLTREQLKQRIAAADMSPDLSGLELAGLNLTGLDFRGANLAKVNLRGANLYTANLSGANLYGADLNEANLYAADLRGANLSEVRLSGANLSRAKGVVAIYSTGDPIIIQSQYTTIGSEYRPNGEWLEMGDKEAIELDIKTEHLEFYQAQIRLGVEFLKATEAAD